MSIEDLSSFIVGLAHFPYEPFATSYHSKEDPESKESNYL